MRHVEDLCNGIYIARIQHLLRTEYKLYYQARQDFLICFFLGQTYHVETVDIDGMFCQQSTPKY